MVSTHLLVSWVVRVAGMDTMTWPDSTVALMVFRRRVDRRTMTGFPS